MDLPRALARPHRRPHARRPLLHDVRSLPRRDPAAEDRAQWKPASHSCLSVPRGGLTFNSGRTRTFASMSTNVVRTFVIAAGVAVTALASISPTVAGAAPSHRSCRNLGALAA